MNFVAENEIASRWVGRGKETSHAELASVESKHLLLLSRASWKQTLPALIAGTSVLAAVFAWAYWPTLHDLVRAWDREPDYSHGFLVVPFGLYFLWVRRDKFPKVTAGLAWPGLILIVLGIGMRILSARFYLNAIDGWSILFWVGGVVWLFYGQHVFQWCLPSVAFLWFMVPLPYRVERWVSLPLQQAATKLSCWTLQILGEPALAKGNVILLGEHQLEIEQACSGLRIFMGIVALAFAYLILVRRTWWERALLLISAVPVALIANSARIVITGLLYQHVSSEAAHKFTHDICGWVMIPLAAMLFALVLWYLSKLVQEVELVDVGEVIRRRRR